MSLRFVLCYIEYRESTQEVIYLSSIYMNYSSYLSLNLLENIVFTSPPFYESKTVNINSVPSQTLIIMMKHIH